MVDLAKMIAAQRAQGAAQPTTPTVENKEELHGQADRNTNTANNEEGVESGTVGAPAGRADEPALRDSARPRIGGLAGLRLNAGGTGTGTDDSSQAAVGAGGSGTGHNQSSDDGAHVASNPDSAVPAGNPVAGGSDGGGNRAAPSGGLAGLKLAASPLPAASPAVAPPAVTTGPGDSLASLSADESSGIPSIQSIAGSGFADEIPATAPARELPEDLTPQMEAFVKSLDNIYLVMSDPELFAQMIRSIMMDLQSNPAYIKMIVDDDVMVMIRGMRESMGLAKMRKETKKRTTSTESKKKAAKSDAMFDTLAALAGDMGMSIE